VDDQQDRLDLVINAMAKESLCTILDLITDPPEDDPYEQLKERLCFSSANGFPAVGEAAPDGRKPSELLHEKTELSLTGYKERPFFLFFFL
jgi:hypothetical protein